MYNMSSHDGHTGGMQTVKKTKLNARPTVEVGTVFRTPESNESGRRSRWAGLYCEGGHILSWWPYGSWERAGKIKLAQCGRCA